MKSLRVCLSLILLGLVLSFGLVRLARAEGDNFCNCYLPNTGQYGTVSADGNSCIIWYCFIRLD